MADVQVQVVVPPGMLAGMPLQISTPDGRIMRVTLPPNVSPGGSFLVRIPPPTPGPPPLGGPPLPLMPPAPQSYPPTVPSGASMAGHAQAKKHLYPTAQLDDVLPASLPPPPHASPFPPALAAQQHSALTRSGAATERLLDAVLWGEDELDAIKEAIAEGADVNAVTRTGSGEESLELTPMMMAAGGSALNVMQCLLDARADINAARASDGLTPLSYAIVLDEAEAVAWLVSHGANVHADAQTAQGKRSAVALARQMSADSRALQSVLPKLEAASTSNSQPVAAGGASSATEGASTISANGSGGCATVSLVEAAIWGDLDLDAVKQAVADGADVNAVGADPQRTPVLVSAALGGGLRTMQCVLEARADVNATRLDGTTALMAAVRKDRLEAVNWLLNEAGADPTRTNQQGMTAKNLAALYNLTKVREVLEALGKPEDGGDGGGRGAGSDVGGRHVRAGVGEDSSAQATSKLLELATIDEDEDKVAAALSNGADVNVVDSHGMTPLMLASMNGDRAAGVARLLIAARADVDAMNPDGMTPLMAAAFWGANASLAQLLEAGASLHARSHKGKSALQIARQFNNRVTVQLLEAAVARDGGPPPVDLPTKSHPQAGMLLRSASAGAATALKSWGRAFAPSDRLGSGKLGARSAEAERSSDAAGTRGAITDSVRAVGEPPSNRPVEGRSEPIAHDMRIVLEGARLERLLATACTWCAEQGIDSLDDLCEAEMEEELVAALDLKSAKAKILRKRIQERQQGAATKEPQRTSSDVNGYI